MKTTYFTAAALLLASYAQASIVGAFNTTAFENEGVIRFWFSRDGDTDIEQSVHYVTKDLSAQAGVHYLASTGTVTFAIGETSVPVDVALIDNGLLDGTKTFELVAGNPSPGVTIAQNFGFNCDPFSFWVGTIRDNELPPTRVDPLFVPEVSPDYFGMVGEMPDKRILIQGGRDGIAMLLPNGLMDSQFFPRDALVLGQRLAPVHIFPDGRILARDGSGTNLVRLSPNGALEQVIHLPVPGYSESDFVAAQPDGKILFRSPTNNWTQIVLHRVNPDGSRDATFMEASFTSDQNEALSIGPAWSGGDSDVVIQPDGKILVAGLFRRVNSVVRSSLARLNPDGSPDHTFSPVLARSDGRLPEIFGLLSRRNGKVIVTGYFQTVNGADRCCFAQLNSDGSLDSSFNPPSMFADWDKGLFLYGLTVEQPDGRQILSPSDTSVMRLNADGSVDPTFAADLHGLPEPSCQDGRGSNHALVSTASGDLLLAGLFDQVDGFPRNGFVRLLDIRPQNDFRVVTPAEFYRSSGIARLEVVRTGPTTNAASVSFSTRDETAKAGEDYVSQSGTLNFAPLEVSKEVTVSLLDRGAAVDRLLTFGLELRNPSTGYTTVGSTPIIILSALRMATESILQRVDGSFAVTLQGTVSGVRYFLETSSDLNSWEEVGQNTATGSMTAVESVALPVESLRFLRARSE